MLVMSNPRLGDSYSHRETWIVVNLDVVSNKTYVLFDPNIALPFNHIYLYTQVHTALKGEHAKGEMEQRSTYSRHIMNQTLFY